MKLSANATADAADHAGGGLDRQLPLAGHHLRGEDLEAIQASSLEAEALRC